jgi:diguanylate cyclase (GGDEF)-like protein/PAS domain S-box-containing protein
MSPLDRLDVLQQVLAILPVGVWLMDETGKIVYGNPAAQAIWGGARYVGPERFGEYRGWWAATGEPIRAEEWAAARAIRSGETSIDEEIEIECFDGARKVMLNSAIPLRRADDRIEGAIIVNHDITGRKRAEERLRAMAERDPLTGAYNRRCLFELLGAEIERARRYSSALSVVMFDVDDFKSVNDARGHEAGDRVLAAVAGLVARTLRAADRLARYGGEEFVVVAPGINRVQAALLAERLRKRIAATPLAGLPAVTCSFGACEYRGESDADALMRRIDALMYRAKRSGRNCVVAQ